jgi:CheY-like chemotaxis protein
VEDKPEVKMEEDTITEEEISINETPEPAKRKNGISSLRCLYIEDQIDSQILFKVQMKELKNIQFAASFEEALPLLESQKFDFIVMDINLQGEYNGLDALKIIHQMTGLENIPVIAVTAYVLPGDKEKFIATGFTDFISKPIFREKLLESLNKIFVN